MIRGYYCLAPGLFGVETFWWGSATSESLRDSDDDGEVGQAASEPNEAYEACAT